MAWIRDSHLWGSGDSLEEHFMDCVTGHFTTKQSATVHSLVLGFIPDLLKLRPQSRCDRYEWERCLHDAGVSGQYGRINAGDSDTIASATFGTSLLAPFGSNLGAQDGISVMDTELKRVAIPNPAGGNDVYASVTVYLDHSATQPTERTISNVGTVTKPSKGGGRVYECMASTAAPAAEPTWSAVYDQQTADGGGNSWICRPEIEKVMGGQGVIIGSNLIGSLMSVTVGDTFHFEAYKLDKTGYLGDAGAGDLSII